MKHALTLLLLNIGACSDGQVTSRSGRGQSGATHAVPAQSAQGESYFCGGETELATVERYFSELEKALVQPGLLSRFNRFVAPRIALTDSRGRTINISVKDVGAVTPGRISVQEWREIQRRGRRSLHDAGYRGCFMDHGKVWFEASQEHGFRVVGIAKNLLWVPLAEGRSVR